MLNSSMPVRKVVKKKKKKVNKYAGMLAVKAGKC